jgi:hypothetical protein
MADNGTQIFIAANGPSYIYNEVTDVFGLITDPDFPGAVTVGYIDGYFVFNEPNSQKIWVTALLEGTSIDPLEFASAEGSPDGVVSVFVDHREVWVFGTNSTEVWYDAGNLDFPLTRIQGAFNEIGCAAPYSVAKMDNQIYWLGKDARGQGVVYRAAGYIGQRISTHAIEWQLQEYENMSDAVGYTYQQDGHSFYVLNFPSANTTWVYDVATGAWHERAAFSNGLLNRHRGNSMCNFGGNIVIGDYENELVKVAKARRCAGIICGHIHQPAIKMIDGIEYLNSGDWVESLTALVEDTEGNWKIIYYQEWLDEYNKKQEEKNKSNSISDILPEGVVVKQS